MTSVRIRPRFKKSCKDTADQITEKFRAEIGKAKETVVGTVLPNYIVIKIPEHHRHFWSPQLSISLDENESEHGTILRGLYGPNPTVWALIFYGYIVLGILGLFFLMAGLSELTLEKDPVQLWVLPGLGVLAVILYFIAQFGQKMGVEQTFQLHHFFEDTLGEHVPIS